jgi:hypothetical protein
VTRSGPIRLAVRQIGGEVSDRQWRDVVAILEAQAGHLDDRYLDETARRVGLADLLHRARADVGFGP